VTQECPLFQNYKCVQKEDDLRRAVQGKQALHTHFSYPSLNTLTDPPF